MKERADSRSHIWNSIPCRDREKFASEEKSSCPEQGRRIFVFPNWAVSQASELVSQSELYFPWVLDRATTTAKRAVRRPCVGSCEDMPVEGVDEFGLENDRMALANLGAFTDRKIFVDVAIASDLAGNPGEIPEGIRAP